MALDPMVTRLEELGLGILVESDRLPPGQAVGLPGMREDTLTPGEGARILRFASDRDTFSALRTAAFNHPDLLDGADVALPAAGLAVAYLLIVGKVGRVFTRVMSQPARAALTEEGIEFKAGSYVKKLPERLLTPMADAERRARASITPQAFLDELKRIRA
jgi:hypothetical protein